MTKAIIVYFLGAALLRAGSIVLLPIFTRNLDPGEYGQLELLYRATDVLVLCLFVSGTCLAVISFYNQARDDEARRRVVGSAVVLNVGFIGLVGLAAVLLARPIGALIGVADPGLVRLAFSAALMESLAVIGLSLLQARLEAIRYTAFALLGLLTRVALVAAFVCLLGCGVRGILLASLLAASGLAVLLIALELRRSGLHFDRETIAGLAWFALPFFPGGICGFLMGTGDQAILSHYATAAEIGLYALGYKLAMLVNLFSRDPLMKVWGAKMHLAAEEPGAPQVFGRVFTGYASIYLLAGLGLVVFGSEVIGLLAPTKYNQAADYLLPVVVAYLFWGAGDLMDASFYLKRRTHLKLGITLATTVVTLALYVLWIPTYRAAGAAWATLAGFLFRACLTYIISQRLFPVAYEWGRLATMLFATVGCWSLAQFVSGPVWVTVPVKAVILGLLPASLWMSGQVAREEKQALYALLDRLHRAVGSRWRSVYTAVRET